MKRAKAKWLFLLWCFSASPGFLYADGILPPVVHGLLMKTCREQVALLRNGVEDWYLRRSEKSLAAELTRQKNETKRKWLGRVLTDRGITEGAVHDALNSTDAKERKLVDAVLERIDPEIPLTEPDIYGLLNALMERRHNSYYSLLNSVPYPGYHAKLAKARDDLIRSYVHELQAAQALKQDYTDRGKLKPTSQWRKARSIAGLGLRVAAGLMDAGIIIGLGEPIVPLLPPARILRWRILNDPEFAPVYAGEPLSNVEARMRTKYGGTGDFELVYNGLRNNYAYQLAFSAQIPVILILGLLKTWQDDEKEKARAIAAREDAKDVVMQVREQADETSRFIDKAIEESSVEVRELESMRDPNSPNPALEKLIAMKRARGAAKAKP